MKIFNWNCNGGFREDFKAIIDKKYDTYVDADIFVIQECEDPEKEGEEYVEYREKFARKKEKNYFWIGNEDQSKGLGIFAKDHVTLEKIGEWKDDIKYFLAVRVNNSFNLLGVWAMDPYVEMIHDFIDANEDNKELFDKPIIMCGDFNSNRIWNTKHRKKDHNGKPKNHDYLNCKLNKKGLYSVYHGVTGEKLKNCEEQDNDEKIDQETRNTFFLYRHLNKHFHIDYFYANEDLIEKTKWRMDKDVEKEDLPNEFEILEKWQWISMSDHLPLVLNLREKIDFEKEYVLHRLTQANLDLFDLEFVASERQYSETSESESLRPDNIAFDGENLVIIEYKNVEYDDESDLDVLEQAKDYEEMVNKHPDEFNYRLTDGKVFPIGEPRVMIIGPKFTKTQIKEAPNNFEFWKVSLYDTGNNKADVEYKNMKTRKIIELKLDWDEFDNLLEEETLEKTNITVENSELYKEFRKEVKKNPDVKLVFFDNGVSFKVNKKTVCQVRLGKNVRVQYNTLNLESNDKRINDIKSSTYLGNYELTLNSKEDIEFACELFEQIYKEKKEE